MLPIGVLISSGNEDRAMWTKMLTLLKEASPILIAEQGLDDHQGKDAAFCGHSFVFVSDRDKSLKPALKEVFSRNLEFSCANHIESNVTILRFGKH